MKLFHISENKNIEKFVPRISKAIWNHEKYVWAISEDKIQNYLFPRECPRICISKNEAKNLSSWISNDESSSFKSHIFVCENWKEELEECKLYQYEFDTSNFNSIDIIAGYYVSKNIEVPISSKLIDNCISELKDLNINVKFISKRQMTSLRKDVILYTKEFSIIKWDNIKE